MIVLGLNFHHDASASIVIDGKLEVAIASERITRKKKDKYIGPEVINYVLEAANITLDDIDYIACAHYAPNDYVKAYQPENNYILQFRDGNYIKGKGYEVYDEIFFLFPPHIKKPAEWGWGQVPWTDLTFEIEGRIFPGYFVNHQLSHCASSFYTSPFENAACFSVDATGIWPESSSMYAIGIGSSLAMLYAPGCMLGTMYDEHTFDIGLGEGLYKAGSMMGLASYGSILPKALQYKDEIIKPAWKRERTQYDPEHLRWQWMAISGHPPFMSLRQNDSKEAMDLAASFQHILEEGLQKYVDELYEDTKELNGGNLCLAGGTMLNCTANGKIRKDSKFKNIHFLPACGDDGTSVGAALYVSYNIHKLPRILHANKDIMYTGKGYDIESEVKQLGENSVEIDYKFLASQIADGKVIAWYQGKSELGPRALCNRSFIADPRNPNMRDYLNFDVKGREWFRPFAPVVMSKRTSEWFEDFKDNESPFMLYTCKVKRPEEVPAISHVDNTARIQTLTPFENPKMFKLLSEFEELTGVPILLNTSLNLGGEPLVETPSDAIDLFERSKADILVIGSRMLIKEA